MKRRISKFRLKNTKKRRAMSLFEDFSDFSLLTNDIEFSRYYELHTDEDGTETIWEISERTFEKKCVNIFEVVLWAEDQGKSYVFTKDQNRTLYLNRYQWSERNRIELFPAEKDASERLCSLYFG